MYNESLTDILNQTREKRIQKLFNGLNEHISEFKDTYISGILFQIPLIDTITYNRYTRYRVRYPIRNSTNTRYIIKMNKHYYQLYKENHNYSFLYVNHDSISIDNEVMLELTSTILYSFVFYLTYSLLESIEELGYSIELYDCLFSGLTDNFNKKNGDIKIYLTPYPEVNNNNYKDIKSSKDKLYISLIN